jgi:WXG100 family type VII secretion target
MATGKVGLTPEQMQASRAQYNKIVADFEAQCKSIITEVGTLSQTWFGNSNVAFSGTANDLVRALDRCNEDLKSIAQAIGDTTVAFENLDADAAKAFRGA